MGKRLGFGEGGEETAEIQIAAHGVEVAVGKELITGKCVSCANRVPEGQIGVLSRAGPPLRLAVRVERLGLSRKSRSASAGAVCFNACQTRGLPQLVKALKSLGTTAMPGTATSSADARS